MLTDKEISPKSKTQVFHIVKQINLTTHKILNKFNSKLQMIPLVKQIF